MPRCLLTYLPFPSSHTLASLLLLLLLLLVMYMSGDILAPPLTGVRDVSAKISTHAADTQKTAPIASELAEQVHTEADRSALGMVAKCASIFIAIRVITYDKVRKLSELSQLTFEDISEASTQKPPRYYSNDCFYFIRARYFVFLPRILYFVV